MMKKILAWFSCGVTSAVACKLAIEKYGKENVIVAYIGIKSAHIDNARFIAACEKWLGVPVQEWRSNKYRDQFEVIVKERFVNGPSGAKCTKELKKKVRERIENEIPYSHQVFGFEFEQSQINRAIRFTEQNPHTKPVYPLIEHKLTKEQCSGILLSNNIALPAMYSLGYHNNNCIGCVKGGKGYWNKIRVDFPETFKKMASAERLINRTCIKETKKIDGKTITVKRFLDELRADEGRHEPPIVPECGTFCEIEFAHLIDKRVDKILSGQLSISAITN